MLAIEMPVPGSDQLIPMMRMVMQIWTAKPEEALRVRAIRELTGYNLWTSYFMNPANRRKDVRRHARLGQRPELDDGGNGEE